MKGHDGNLYESSWRHKGKRLIGFKKSAEDEYVVTDLVVVTDDKDGPDDYAPIPITKDTRKSRTFLGFFLPVEFTQGKNVLYEVL